MAKGTFTGGRQFKKGHPGGPGRPRLSEDVKEARALTRNDLDRYLTQFMAMGPTELEAIKKNPKSTMLELLIASIITHGISKGDQQRLGFLLERLSSIGKVKERVELSGGVKLLDLVLPTPEKP